MANKTEFFKIPLPAPRPQKENREKISQLDILPKGGFGDFFFLNYSYLVEMLVFSYLLGLEKSESDKKFLKRKINFLPFFFPPL